LSAALTDLSQWRAYLAKKDRITRRKDYRARELMAEGEEWFDRVSSPIGLPAV